MTVVTHHADHRLRRRFGLPRRAVARVAEAALVRGASRFRFSGRLRRYLDDQASVSGADLRVLAGHVFVFHGDVLVTGWPLPGSLRRHRPAPNRQPEREIT